jgi:hypothetical protein
MHAYRPTTRCGGGLQGCLNKPCCCCLRCCCVCCRSRQWACRPAWPAPRAPQPFWPGLHQLRLHCSTWQLFCALVQWQGCCLGAVVVMMHAGAACRQQMSASCTVMLCVPLSVSCAHTGSLCPEVSLAQQYAHTVCDELRPVLLVFVCTVCVKGRSCKEPMQLSRENEVKAVGCEVSVCGEHWPVSCP